MPRDPLPVLLRARRLAQGDARRTLTDGLRAEDDATARLADADHAIAREAAAISASSAGELAGLAYPAWLARARSERRNLQAVLEAASVQTEARRQRLQEARTATRAVEVLLAEQAAKRSATETRNEQRYLDEAGQRRTSG